MVIIIFHDHHQDKADQLEETTEAFEGCDYQAEVETGMASEIKIAEIVEMHCEEEFLTEDEDNTEFRAEVVDVGCDLDREVAELMRDGREGPRLSIQVMKSICLSFKSVKMLKKNRPGVPSECPH